MTEHPLRALRRSRGLTQVQLAELAGVSQQRVSQIENGEHIYYGGTLMKIAKAVGVSVAEIIDRDQSELATLLDRKAIIAGWLGLDPAAPGTEAYLTELRQELVAR